MNNSNLNWKTKDGKFIPLDELKTEDLRYILRFIDNSGFSHYSGISANQWKRTVNLYLEIDRVWNKLKLNKKLKAKINHGNRIKNRR